MPTDERMPARTAIAVHNLGKAYRVWETPFKRLSALGLELLADFLASPIGHNLRKQARKGCRDFHALQGVSFEIPRGAIVGIIGRNGSGKSTLLQIIAGTLRSTTGTVEVTGRVGALLELGTGFNPEFTGRENVFLTAAILGIDSEEAASRIAEVEAFADIGDFIDQPVKTYSSGMMVRLAFAIHTMTRPEILIIDEALAVGDEAFQRKCFARLEAMKEMGVTILLVSHATTAIVELCERCLLLHGGRLLLDGPPKAVVQQYHRLIYSAPEKQKSLIEQIRSEGVGLAASPGHSPESAESAAQQAPDEGSFLDPNLRSQSVVSYPPRGARIEQIEIRTPDGARVNNLVKGARYLYCFDIRFERDCHQVRPAHVFKTLTGVELGGTTLRSPDLAIPLARSGQTARVTIQFRCLMNPGTYLANAGVLAIESDSEIYLHRVVDALVFRVLPPKEHFHSCYVDFDFRPRVLLLSEREAETASAK